MRWLVLLAALVLTVPAWGNPAQAVTIALADAKQLGPAAVDAAYLDGTTFSPQQLDTFLNALAFAINSLSRNPEPVKPVLLPGNVLRVPLSELGWSRKVWDRQALLDPYFSVRLVRVYDWPGGVWNDGRHYNANAFKVQGEKADYAPWLGNAINELGTLTQSQVPIVRADWWFVNAFRQQGLNGKENGFGYYDWLEVRDRTTFQALVRLDEKVSRELLLEHRAVIEDGTSGVSQHNRGIVRLKSYVGAYWLTLDTDSSIDELKDGKLVRANNATRHIGRGELQHKAEEHYAALPNGLFAFLLCDDKGKLQASAPDFIGSDDSPLRQGKDSRIHVGIACVRCHVEGLRPIDDWMRRTFRGPSEFQTYDKKKHEEVKRQYFSNLDKKLAEDRLVYVDALREVNGLTPLANAAAVAELYNWYFRKRTVANLAVELGVEEAKLKAALVKVADPQFTPDPNKRLPYELFGSLAKGGTLSVPVVEERFATLMGLVK